MKSFSKLAILLILSLPYFLSSCTKDELSSEGVSSTLPSFLSNYGNTENHSSVKVKADLSIPVKESWLNEKIKFGHHTSVLIENQFIYAPTRDGIAKINRLNGDVIWSLDFADLPRGNMSIDGNIIFASAKQVLYAIDKNTGTTIWIQDLKRSIFTAPVISGSNVIINDAEGNVYAFDKISGTNKWWYLIPGGTYGSAIVKMSNKVFIASGDGEIHCIDSGSGKGIWVFNENCKSFSCHVINTPLILHGNNILFGNSNGQVFSITTDGNLSWNYNHPTRIYFKGAALSKEKIVLTGDDGNKGEHTICVDIVDRKLLWHYQNGLQSKISLPMIVNDRFVIVGSSAGLDNLDILTGKQIWNKTIKMTSGYIKNQCISNIAVTDLDLVYTTADGKLARFVY